MSDKRVQVILGANDVNLINALKRSEAGIKGFASKSVNVFNRVNASVGRFSEKTIGVLGQVGIGVGFGVAAKKAMEFDSALRSIGRKGGFTGAEMGQLKSDILALSRMPISIPGLTEMAAELNNTGLSLKMIKAVLPDVAKGAVAAGMKDAPEAYAAAIGELLDKYQVAAKDLPALQDQINKSLKMDDVRKDPASFLKSIEGLSKTMQLMKAQGIENVTPLLALQAQLTSFTGSSGEAAGALDAVFNGLLRVSKNKKLAAELKQHDVDFFDSKGSIKNISLLLPQFRKLAEEARKSGRSMEDVSLAVFGRPEAAKAILMIVQKYDDIIKKQKELRASTGDMAQDYKTEAESMTAKLQQFQNQVNRFNIDHVSVALNKLKGALDFLQAHPIVTKGLMWSLVGVGGAVALNKVIEVVRGIGGLFKVSGAAGGLGKALGAGAPVFVTNMPGSGIPGTGGGANSGLGTRDVDFSTGQKAAGLGALKIAGLGLVGVEAMLALAYQQSASAEAAGLRKWRTENPSDYARSQEVMGGKPALVPSIGPMDLSVKKNAPYFGQLETIPSAAPVDIKNNITLSVNIDKNGRVTTKSNDLNTRIEVPRSRFLQETEQ